MYKLENNVEWTDDLKSAFKHNVTRAKILYDNIEINENNYLKNLTLDEQNYISNYGFVGVATAKKLELNLLGKREGKNLYNNATKSDNIALIWTSGLNISETKSISTDYIELNNISSICSNYFFAIFFYDENKTYLGNSTDLRKTTGSYYKTVQIPSNNSIKYCRLSIRTGLNGNIDMTSVTDLMVTKTQSELTPYEPYLNDDLNLENKELELKIGADYNGNTYYINYGKFIVDKAPQIDETTGTIRVVAYDYMIKFNKPYVDRVTYPCSLLTLLQDVCSQAGVILGSTDFANKNFVVENNQFEGFTLREVLQNIAKCAFSWARIGQDNKLYLDFNIVPETTETITIDDYKANAFKKANEYYGPVNQVTYADSDIEGQEDRVKDQQSIDEYGLKELVIYDNLFAYTAEKRHELIQAGTRLLGLTYMPISQLELIGLAYLDCRDAIAVETLDEETFTSRVFSHQIQYNGTLHDSIITEGTSNNEEVYKNTATTVFQNQQTQIKIDKANKNIKLLTEQVDDQSSRISQMEIDIDGIETQVSNMYNATKTVSGTKQIVLENCIKGYLIKLRILGNNNVFDRLYPADDLYPSDTLYPRGDSRIIVTDNAKNSMTYELRINDVLRANEEVYDEYILEDNFAKVIRRVNPDGTTKLIEEEEIIGRYTIYVGEGTNTVRIQNYSANIEIIYVEQNAYTDQFATNIEMESRITQTAEEINTEVRKKVGEDEVISKINQSAEAVTILANKLGLTANDVINIISGNSINLTSKNITINSDNFNVNENGEMTCADATIIDGDITLTSPNGNTGGTTSFNIVKDGRYVKLKEYYNRLLIENSTANVNASIMIGDASSGVGASMGLEGISGNDFVSMSLDDTSGSASLTVSGGGAHTTILPTGVNANGTIYNSKESLKKNIIFYNKKVIDILKKSELYEYNYKYENDNYKKHIGFIIGDEGGDYKTPDEVVSADNEGIDSYTMTSILWKAVQEQQELIEQLQKQINELKGGN